MRCEISTDFLVIGSGAAGSVIAYELAAAGERVVVAERGAWLHPREMTHDELAMAALLYKDGGGQMNTSMNMFVLQGSCVGGTTVLTNGVMFKIPERVRAVWSLQGLELSTEELAQSYAHIQSVMGVAPMPERAANPATPLLENGMLKYGAEPRRFMKNIQACLGCGYCNIGCAFGRKRDAAQTWVPMSVEHGAEIIAQCEVRRLAARRGQVAYAECRDLRDGTSFRIRAKTYILSGGAINSPELLLKSGIGNASVGRGMSFNAGAIVFAEFPNEIDAFLGDQMALYHFGDGYAIEQLHNPPMAFALTMPGWYREHYENMLRYRRFTAAGVLIPTASTGRVSLGIGHRILRPLFDHADVAFDLSAFDLCHLKNGFREAASMFLAAGAVRVIPPIAEYTEIRTSRDLQLIDARVHSQCDLVGFGSSHPQGGLNMGGGGQSAVDPDFRVRGMENLYVCDASIFPSSVEVNPQLPIMAVARAAARAICGTTALTHSTNI